MVRYDLLMNDARQINVFVETHLLILSLCAAELLDEIQ